MPASRRPSPLLASLLLGAFSVPVLAAPPNEAGFAFFEKKVRPVLVAHCYKCHSAEGKAPKGGLRLDSREALRKGGESGPAIVPGKPEASLLVKALHFTDDLRMPPRGKLPAAVIADLEKWIAAGAPDPRIEPVAATSAIDFQAARKHWAFQPIRRPVVPPIARTPWADNPVDRFLLARLEAKGLTPSARVDRRTLLRRVSFDLVGLPPTPDEVDAFVHDPRPDAYQRVVDRLLASPGYGERWGRHWLDVARYADTKDGVLMYGDDRVRPYAYTYRDYVIRAFNEDLPFDQFVHDQLAADRIESRIEPWRLAGMGFLTLGRMFDNNVHDILDDRIDTVTRGLLGLTVSCARCHDHKYDPIPIADYYSLYGVFASSEAPIELPLLDTAGAGTGLAAFEKQAETKRREVRAMLDSQYTTLLETAQKRVGDYLVHVATTQPDPLETAIFFLSLAPTDLRPQIVHRWRRLLDRRAVPGDPVFAPWFDLFRLDEARLGVELPTLRRKWHGIPAGTDTGTLNPAVLAALDRARISSRTDVARAYGDLLRGIHDRAKKSAPLSKAEAQLLALVTSSDSPAYFPRTQTRDYMSRGDKDAFGGKLQELDRMAVRSPHAPPRAMVLVDSATLLEPRIFLRGDASRHGDRVPRQFLRIVAGDQRKPFASGSGRLDLARAITAPDNPLTARVLVNRVWMHHFREPLVDSPSDFGLRTAPPTHPELLDYLASELVDSGWALKPLHRLLVLSSAYQQASDDRPACRTIDPDNRLLWRTNRRRLDLESMRDSLLAVSGRLDRQVFGRPVDVAGDATNRRRTVYGLVDRQSLPGLFRAFDFASPDQSAERRPQTTVPQQALFGMNAPFVVEQARALASRAEIDRTSSPEERVRMLYRLALGRQPTPFETRLAVEFVAATQKARSVPAKSRLDAWGQLAQVVLLTNEMLFVD